MKSALVIVCTVFVGLLTIACKGGPPAAGTVEDQNGGDLDDGGTASSKSSSSAPPPPEPTTCEVQRSDACTTCLKQKCPSTIQERDMCCTCNDCLIAQQSSDAGPPCTPECNTCESLHRSTKQALATCVSLDCRGPCS